jgi:citrate synthase
MANSRVSEMLKHFNVVSQQRQASPNCVSGKNTLTVVDNRTGKKYELPIEHNTVNIRPLFKFKGDGVPGLRAYDPGYMNTASCTSRITYIDGPAGKLRYRGYPIEQLAEKSTFLEVAYLLIYGQLPDTEQMKYWNTRVMRHTYIHEDLKHLMKNFRYDAHPMGMVISAVSAMSTFHPEANPALAGQDIYNNVRVRNKQVHRIVGTMPTVAAFAYRHRIGRPYVDPRSDLGYAENFLYMLDSLGDRAYKPHPKLARALDILFILHADHEQNCSTTAMRHLTSSGVDVYSAIAGATAALYGPRHGGANEAVIRMLQGIGSADQIPAFIEKVKNKTTKLMGFGHRVYKNYDPRARIIKKIAHDVFAILGKEPLIEVATALEKVALSDPYFIKRKLYPNVDFYSGLIYKAMGFPTDFFPVLFTIPRTVGWLSNWYEFLDDPENRIVRPRQRYVGAGDRDYVPLAHRTATTKGNIVSFVSSESKRRQAKL